MHNHPMKPPHQERAADVSSAEQGFFCWQDAGSTLLRLAVNFPEPIAPNSI
jgi:hypothetical protein